MKVDFLGETPHGYKLNLRGEEIIVPKHKIYFNDGIGYVDYNGEKLVFKMILENPKVWRYKVMDILPDYLSGGEPIEMPDAVKNLVEEIIRVLSNDDMTKNQRNSIANHLGILLYITWNPDTMKIEKNFSSGYERAKDEIINPTDKFSIDRWKTFLLNKKKPISKWTERHPSILSVEYEGTTLQEKIDNLVNILQNNTKSDFSEESSLPEDEESIEESSLPEDEESIEESSLPEDEESIEESSLPEDEESIEESGEEADISDREDKTTPEEEIMKSETEYTMPTKESNIEVILTGVDGVNEDVVLDTIDKERKIGMMKTRSGKVIKDKYVVLTKGPAGNLRPKIITLVTEKLISKVPEARKTNGGFYTKKSKVRVKNSSTGSGKKTERLSLEYRVAQLYKAMGDAFSFPNEMTQKVFFATWLMRNGSVVLKGVPGTGKTTLTESATYMLCDDIDYDRSDEQYVSWRYASDPKDQWRDGPSGSDAKEYSLDDVDFFSKSEFGTVGIAKHNPNKTPDEILYKTEIVLDKYLMLPGMKQNPPKLVRKHVMWLPGVNKNPPDMFRSNPGLFQERQEYNFIPRPRAIVAAPIKFHNECSRMSSVVADAVLGLMAEGQVEHLGSVFESPSEGVGSISIYDLNPHLEEVDRGLDWAFTDRIDVGLWLPAPQLYNYWQVLRKSVRLEATFGPSKEEDVKSEQETIYDKTRKGDPRTVSVSMMNYDVPSFKEKPKWLDENTVDHKYIEPLTYDELQLIWKRIEDIPIEEGVLIRASTVMKLFSISWNIYNPLNYSNENLPEIDSKNGINYNLEHHGLKYYAFIKSDGELAEGLTSDTKSNTFVDKSYATEQFHSIGGGVNKPNDVGITEKKDGGKTAQGYFTDSQVPLGMRAIKSLLRLARSLKYLNSVIENYEKVQNGKSHSSMFESTENMKIKIEDEDLFWGIIPFVVSHRLHGERISKDIYRNYLNVQDWSLNVVNNFRAISWSKWDGAIRAMEETLDLKANQKIRSSIPNKPLIDYLCVFSVDSDLTDPTQYYKIPIPNKKKEDITQDEYKKGILGFLFRHFWLKFEEYTGESLQKYVDEGVLNDPILYQIEQMFYNFISYEKIVGKPEK
jgi:hypothetical protein